MAERPPLGAGLEFVVLVFAAAGVGTFVNAVGLRLLVDESALGLTSVAFSSALGSTALLGIVAGVGLGVTATDRSAAVTGAGVGAFVGFFLLLLLAVLALWVSDSIGSLTETLSAITDVLGPLLVQAVATGAAAAVAALAGHRLAGAESTSTRGRR